MPDAKVSSWNDALDETKSWVKENTPWQLKYESTSFGDCELSILSTLQPQKKTGDYLWPNGPQRAHILFCNGPISAETGARLEATYRGLSEPKFLVAFGAPALTGSALAKCPQVAAHIADLLPVHVYVLSFPPRPETLLDGVIQLLTPLAEAHPPSRSRSRLDQLPAEVLQRHLERLHAPPTREEMMRDQTLAERPPL